ncbi:MAG: DUF2339 domain-containing protein, partial [Candidatus Nanoarchaeia archaeon]
MIKSRQDKISAEIEKLILKLDQRAKHTDTVEVETKRSFATVGQHGSPKDALSQQNVNGKTSAQFSEPSISSTSAPITPPPLPTKDEFNIKATKRFVETPSALIEEESEFERSAREIFAKIWSWIAVGEEYRPRNVSLEYAIASVWLLRSSMIIILTGIGLFLKYSIENNLIGPVARIAIGILTGISMIAIGAKMAGKKYHLIAQGLLGAGIATLYLSIFAGYKIYAIIPDAMLAFLLMSFVTFFAAILAIRLNSMLTAILGIIGGYFTPIALSTGTADFMMLFSYLLMLGIGIVAIAKYKDWKLLNAMSFIFTYALYWSALAKYYSANQFCVAMVFLSLFFLLFASIPIINNIYHAQKSNALTLVGMFLNALSFFLSAALLISDIYGRKWISLATISLAVFYSLQILFFLNRKLVDRNLLTLLTGFASFFLIITVPLLLSDKWITAVWSFQALMFLWISVRTKSNFVRLLSFIIYFLAFMRLALFDLYENFSTPVQEKYFEELMTRLVTFGSLIVSMAIGYKFLKSGKYNKVALISSENDTADLIPLNVSISILAGIGAMLLFVYLHFEFRSFSACFYPPCKPTLFSTIWASAIVISTLLYARSKNLFLIALSAILAVGL